MSIFYSIDPVLSEGFVSWQLNLWLRSWSLLPKDLFKYLKPLLSWKPWKGEAESGGFRRKCTKTVFFKDNYEKVHEMIILMMPFSKTMFSSTKTTDTTQHITLLVIIYFCTFKRQVLRLEALLNFFIHSHLYVPNCTIEVLIKRPRRSTRSWKPQVFQEQLQSSAKTAGSYTSGAFKAGSLFILTNFLWLTMCFQTCGQLVVIEWKCWAWDPGTTGELVIFSHLEAMTQHSYFYRAITQEAEKQHLLWWNRRTGNVLQSKLCLGHFSIMLLFF